jgi:uncharacterized protein YbcI
MEIRYVSLFTNTYLISNPKLEQKKEEAEKKRDAAVAKSKENIEKLKNMRTDMKEELEKEETEKEEQLKGYRVKGFTPDRVIEFDQNGELEIFE